MKALVDLEVYSMDGQKVHQKAMDNQAFGPGETKVVLDGLARARPTQQPGEYVVKVGVFTPGWGKVLRLERQRGEADDPLSLSAGSCRRRPPASGR